MAKHQRASKLAFFALVASFSLCSLCVGVARADTLRIFAAASLTEAFSDIGEAFETTHREATVELNFAGSQVLQTQVEQGAQADIFAAADRVHADRLVEQNLLRDVVVFAHNMLVVVTPAEESHVNNLSDLSGRKVRIVVANGTVPAGRYTVAVLEKMASNALYGRTYRDRVQKNIASMETNVRAVLAKVALGEADAGFVYRTDAATAAGKVRVIPIPDELNVVAEYPIGIVAESKMPELAGEFVALVVAPAGQAILERHGFLR